MASLSNTININNRLIAFTTPETYAVRLSPLITLKGWTPLWFPTISVGPTAHTKSSLVHYLTPPSPIINSFSALAFTSRNGISAFLHAMSSCIDSPPLSPCSSSHDNDKWAGGYGRKVLCPVPLVVGLDEPEVVPNFLRQLHRMGWVAVKVDAYETQWMASECGVRLLETDKVDAIVFTSTAEVQGLLKSLKVMGLEWSDVAKRNPGMVVAAHGPVTAAGAESFGVCVNVVSTRFGSFDGVVDALDQFWSK
uniref:Tetrapyrrole biosynthesis, uroporphyrinogen III synthase n=1 Tax=Tanacetum cinerariifolium TaxID=118510 RepID=A0A699GU20_TANCI|nr:tetrapyrrole biosynthesis, uroporphyrinogen III synthase [Tanacetum cinerariifolium]